MLTEEQHEHLDLALTSIRTESNVKWSQLGVRVKPQAEIVGNGSQRVRAARAN